MLAVGCWLLVLLCSLGNMSYAQAGYGYVDVINNSDYDVCINQMEVSPPSTCVSPGSWTYCVYRNLPAGDSTTLETVLGCGGNHPIITVEILNHGCPNSCLTPTAIRIGPGGSMSGSFTPCGTSASVSYSWTPNPGTSCSNTTTATLTLN